MKRKLKKLSGYANDNVKIWVIQNEIRDCIDENEIDNWRGRMKEDEKIEIHPNKDVIKRDKYTTLKGNFLGSREKPLREHEEETNSDILSCERSLEEKDNKKGNEHYVHTLSIDKLCTKDLNGKNEDACATSIEVHIIPNKNVDILPIPIKRTRKDYGKEPLQALCGIPEHVMKTRTSKERKPRKFKIFPFVHNLRKMGKCQVLELIIMSCFRFSQSPCPFVKTWWVLNHSIELLVDFDHEHGVRGDFECLRPRQNLLDVVINLEASKLNYFERRFIGIRSIRCYLSKTFSKMILCGSPQPFFDRKTSIVSKYISELDDCEKLFIPMHDNCDDHWYLCIIDFKNSHIQILDSLRSRIWDEFRFKSVKTVCLSTEELTQSVEAISQLIEVNSQPVELVNAIMQFHHTAIGR
uniref:Ubiquitin-like protease family profile domain-containing protein n=1 Tax=Vitis vinifera TaxID=29760 RepID=A5ALZ0_VITVI|nr:hypothetical protein VITISV_027897 [Vitis vinifera]